jgi:membrane-associated protein
MLSETIIQLVEQYGYLIFFLAFSLGPFGIPVPNEVTILTGGIMADNGMLNPWLIYICILMGLMTAVTLGYFIGKLFGKRVNQLLKKKCNRQLIKAEKLFSKYGDIAMCVAFFIPFVRYVVPVLVGMNGMKFKKFAFLSYTSAVIWTVLFFGIGKIFGTELSEFLMLIDLNMVGIGGGIFVVAAFIIKVKIHRKKSFENWVDDKVIPTTKEQ